MGRIREWVITGLVSLLAGCSPAWQQRAEFYDSRQGSWAGVSYSDWADAYREAGEKSPEEITGGLNLLSEDTYKCPLREHGNPPHFDAFDIKEPDRLDKYVISVETLELNVPLGESIIETLNIINKKAKD
ncbi:MAG: hypothetical protein ACP5D2_01315 [Candidatus Nanoarchaeia archaeon]